MAWWITIIFSVVLSRPVFCDRDIKSALQEVQKCLGINMQSCLSDQAIVAFLNSTQLVDFQNSTADTGSLGRVEDLLLKKMLQVLSSSHEETFPIQTGRSRTFHKAWKYMIPFLIGVMLKIATFVPMVLTVLTVIAKNAFIAGNLALLFTGINIALKYWQSHPKAFEDHHLAPHHNAHGAYSNPAPYHNPYGGYLNLGHSQGYGASFGQYSPYQSLHAEDYQHDAGSYPGHQSDAHLKRRRILNMMA